ncbi:tRNA 5-methylaminomethyl-2-thiouridine synthase tusC [Vibrio ishigakensis]|uniref:Protein TusC homolog n=1 Tax=Vibrio ishigakensis TaxID=1481914 RepID=A0A0B8PGF7_9VIBR|nr:tRNA 5-methylaminomethyl-2-thiouridine synthase tusC [Vibrio ishigakensis]
MKQLGFIFSSAPHSTAQGREGLDAILATSALSENITVFFVGQGVNQLLRHQQPQSILSRDYIAAFRLFDLYDVEQVYVCESSLNELGFEQDDLILDCEFLSKQQIAEKLSECVQVLRF